MLATYTCTAMRVHLASSSVLAAAIHLSLNFSFFGKLWKCNDVIFLQLEHNSNTVITFATIHHSTSKQKLLCLSDCLSLLGYSVILVLRL